MATILSKTKSSFGNPYCYYKVESTSITDRTVNTVKIAVKITSNLASSQSHFGTGYTLNAQLYLNGSWSSNIQLKGSSDSWSGTNEHTKTATLTVSGLSATQTSITGVKFKVTSSASDDACQLNSTNCNNITIPAGLAPSPITSVSSGTTDYYPAVVWTPLANILTYKIKYSYGNWSYTTGLISPASTSQQTYNSYQITGANVAQYMTTAETATFTATLYTYQDDGVTQVGDAQTKTFTVTLNASYKPTASVGTFTDAGRVVPSSWGIFVQGKSKLSFTVSATASAGSTISSYSTAVNGTTYTSTSITTGFLTSSGSLAANLTVTDSRGRTATASRSYTCYPYSNPSITTAVGERCLQNGTLDDAGTYLKYSFAGVISSCNNKNVATCRLGYKLKTASTYTYVNINNNVNNVVLSGVTFNASLPYDIIFEIKDSFNATGTEHIDLRTGFKLVHYNANKQAIALGKSSEAQSNQRLLEVALPISIDDAAKPSVKTLMLDLVYPIGSIYMSVNNVSPQTFLGGTWSPIQDTFLLSAGSTYAAGGTGGEATHTLVENEIPAHTHGNKTLKGQWRSTKARFPGGSEHSGIITEWVANQSTYWSSAGGKDSNTVGWKIDASHEHTSFGGSSAHNNMPPYLVVYMWKRTA